MKKLVIHPDRQQLILFLQGLRQEMIEAFEKIEPCEKFERKAWNYEYEGGGEMAVLRGEVFEKAAVNWSGVGGPALPLAGNGGAFFATGVSLITHMSNPHAPTAHFNLRFIETEDSHWFAGGYDLTPMGFTYAEDTEYFHLMAQEALKPFGKDLYSQLANNAKEYFYIPHRQRERGVGGIFFDHWNTGHFDTDRAMWEKIGHSFLKALLPIYQKRVSQPFTNEEKEIQLRFRAHYAEFNLIYDRGTKFGFQSGGNPEAILCSMPPVVKW